MKDADLTFREDGLIIPENLEKAYDLIELISERAGMWTMLVQTGAEKV